MGTMAEEKTQANKHLLPDRLVAWIEKTLGGTIERIKPRAGGGAVREGAEVDVQLQDGTLRPCFLAYARNLTSTRGLGTDMHYRREGSVLTALLALDILSPPLISYSVEERALLFDFVPGETMFAVIKDPAEREQVSSEFIQEIAKLHQIDPAPLKLDGFGTLGPVDGYIRERLDALEGEHYEGGDPDPLIVFALDWLGRNIPDFGGPTVLVHGDAGPANFLHLDGKVTVVLDWELCHFGDPMEDFAWISIRSLFQPFVPLPGLMAEYERASGIPVGVDRIRFYRIYCLLGLMVGSHRTWVQQPEKIVEMGGAVGTSMGYSMLHKRVLVEELADAMGVDLPEVRLPDGEKTLAAPYFEVALNEIRDVIVPRSTDQVATHRAKGLARLIKYLQAREELSSVFDKDELEDLANTLGRAPAGLSEGRLKMVEAIREGDLDDETIFGVLYRRVTRDTAILAPSMGALAERHYPPLT